MSLRPGLSHGKIVEPVLFSITCTTCEARLNVRDKSAIGAIVTCPKCGSMVQVIPPIGWEEPAEPEPPPATAPAPDKPRPRQQQPKPAKKPPEPAPVDSSEPAGTPAPESGEPAAAVTSPAKPSAKKAAAVSAALAGPAAAAGPPPLPEPRNAATATAEPPVVETPPVQTLEPGTEPVTRWTSPAEVATRRWLVWSTVPVAGVVLLVGALSYFWGGNGSASQADDPAAASAESESVPPVSAAPAMDFGTRWIPDSPQVVVSLEIARSDADGQLGSILRAVPPLREAIVDELFAGFGLKAEAVERLVWSASDLWEWSEKGVVVVTLAEGQSTDALRSSGSRAGTVNGTDIRRLQRPAWPRPFAVLDERTFVTGDEELLRRLAKRGEKPAKIGLLEPLLVAAPADTELFFALDLREARTAGWPLPTQWLDVWPLGREPWRVIWNLPAGVSFTFDRDDLALAELGFLCDSPSVAEKVRVALEQWLSQAESVFKARIDRLAKALEAGKAERESSGRYALALGGALAALESVRTEMIDRTVWLRADCGRNAAAWMAAAAGSAGAIRSDWYEAAGTLDAQAHQRLTKALAAYGQAEGQGPQGALGSDMMAPDKLLSWVSAMLPYLGHESWQKQLHASYSWDSPKNQSVTRRPLEAVRNPAIPVEQTAAGYPVTHYVGVAGIGPDAASLPRDDPRAGVFGYRGSRRLDDIPDGASNTIATAGVSESLGPWASGGSSTVRGFTQKPYVNGPDGFGSGQPGGMYVGMADGSSRFLAAEIDPTVLEQLVTAAGQETPQPAAVPAEETATVEPEPTEPADGESPVVVDAEVTTNPAADASLPAELVEPETRLRMPVMGIAIDDVPLHQAVRSLENYGSFLVTYDLDTLSAMGVALDRPVSYRVTESTVGGALQALLATCRLRPAIRENQVWITGPAADGQRTRVVRYAVSDLTPDGGPETQELAAWITRLVAPQTWQDVGGPGSIRARATVLEIDQSETVHREILTFCEKLRVARNLPLRSRRPAAKFRLETRIQQAAPVLQQPITVNFFQPTALRRVVAELDRLSDAQIAVNWLALADEGRWPSLPATVSGDQAPLQQLLQQLVDPLGLACRVIDDRTIQITTRRAIETHYEREFYPVGQLLNPQRTAPRLIDQVRSEIGAAAWDSGGGRGVLLFDEPSRCMIVYQNQPAQAAVQALLESL